jgi:type II secretory pathway pseudopilin PulG
MPRRAPCLKPNGFTTIESLIAAVVFLVGLAGLLGALVQARGSTGQARRLMQATDVANDLAEQIQLWDFDDPRLSPTDPSSECGKDPLDTAGMMLLEDNDSQFQGYKLCLHGEADIQLPGSKFGGLATPSFRDESGVETVFERYYIVRVEDVRVGVRRMQVWVKVRYKDAGQPRVVTTQTMRVQMGGV